MFSGGWGSWAACKRAAERHGTAGGTLLFADTRKEDGGLYEWLPRAAADVGCPLISVADGRTPFEVFHDERFLGNTQRAKCSVKLKVLPCRRWMKAHAGDATIVVGIGWDEIHRLPEIVRNWEPWRVWAPLCEEPYLDRGQGLTMMRACGLEPPPAYGEGFPHNNCLAQGCVKGGQAYWAHMLKTRPEVYARMEAEEEALRRHLGKDVAILRDRRGGKTKPLPLATFRKRIESGGSCDLFE